MTEPLYEQIYKNILTNIETGQLKPGDRVPSEKELSTQYNVSRITSKRALQILDQQGLIDRARGKGSFVSQNVAVSSDTIEGNRKKSPPTI